jgi:hypothetical protein
MRTICMLLVVSMLGACGGSANSGRPDRSVARNILIGLAVGTAAFAVGTVVAGQKVEKDLRDDLQRGGVSGEEFADRDKDGTRWNRMGRAAAFGSGLSILGLGIIWEMGQGDRMVAPSSPAPEADRAARVQSSATAK